MTKVDFSQLTFDPKAGQQSYDQWLAQLKDETGKSCGRTAYWAARFLLVDLRIDEISPTGGQRFKSHPYTARYSDKEISPPRTGRYKES